MRTGPVTLVLYLCADEKMISELSVYQDLTFNEFCHFYKCSFNLVSTHKKKFCISLQVIEHVLTPCPKSRKQIYITPPFTLSSFDSRCCNIRNQELLKDTSHMIMRICDETLSIESAFWKHINSVLQGETVCILLSLFVKYLM